jgi:Tol biopolymer transport system component
LRDRLLGTTECVSVRADGTAFPGRADEVTMSHDGRFIAFATFDKRAFNHEVIYDIYLRDRITGTVTRVNRNSDGILANRTSHNPVLNADGRFVVWNSAATNLSPEVPTTGAGVYIRELFGTTATSSR